MKTPPPDPAFEKAVAWFCILLGLACCGFIFSRAYDKLTSPYWPVVTAQVVKSDMYQHTGRSRQWCLRMTYQYQVDGKTYRSRNLGVSIIGDAGCDRNQGVIAARLERLGPGAPLRVRHHPREHGFAAAYEMRLDIVDYLMGAAGIALVATGLYELRRVRLSQM